MYITSARVPDDVKRAANQRDDVIYFTSFCASRLEFAGLVVGASQRSLTVTLKTDLFLLWDATHAWTEHRKTCIEHTSALDNGWYRHAARLMARLQKHELYDKKGRCVETLSEQIHRKLASQWLSASGSRFGCPSPCVTRVHTVCSHLGPLVWGCWVRVD